MGSPLAAPESAERLDEMRREDSSKHLYPLSASQSLGLRAQMCAVWGAGGSGRRDLRGLPDHADVGAGAAAARGEPRPLARAATPCSRLRRNELLSNSVTGG